MFTKEQQKSMLHRAARSSNMDGHIVATSPPVTMAERAMTWFGGKKNTPRKNSYLYCNSVDAFAGTAGGGARSIDGPNGGGNHSRWQG